MTVRSWMPWVLGVSVLFNVFAFGAVVGLGAAGVRLAPAKSEGASGLRDRSMLGIVQELPQEDRRAAARAVVQDRRQLRAMVRSSEEARREVYRLLGAPTLDVEAARAAMATAREADAAILTRGHEVLIGILAQTGDADRIAAVEAVRNRPPRSGDRPWRRPPPPDDDGPPPPSPE